MALPSESQGAGAAPGVPVSDVERLYYSGKSILVTGASGGLGGALATRIAEIKTARLLVLSGRDATRLNGVAEACSVVSSGRYSGQPERGGTRIEAVPCNLSVSEDVSTLCRAAQGFSAEPAATGAPPPFFSAIDVLINAGGLSSRSSFLETEASVDQAIMEVNFFAGARLSKMLVPAMTTSKGGRGGAVVWISSVQGLFGLPFRSSYAASKFAIQGYAESMRAELACEGVRIHTVSPGYIRTGLSKSALTGDGSAHGKTDDTTAFGADPYDVACSILADLANGRNPDGTIALSFSARAALWLKFLFPSVLRKMLEKRFQKGNSSST
eukprot:CAMPEP_0194281892 /NCGR_PEP_ID=MMETSP0169-20130528/21818_1 /TAXON_ID=218684 /ORGANISM="Corethron pennatum, Strain L29A3" /LENGTH=326 /DNA_ID=CAMNT_0039027063 /DNA_START=145 /DNA_END=1125 /DNA_ORIENTATION=+